MPRGISGKKSIQCFYISGTVAGLLVSEGDSVFPGTPLFKNS